MQRSKRKVRERRSGVVVGGQVYGVKAQPDQIGQPVSRRPARPPEPRQSRDQARRQPARSVEEPELPLEHEGPDDFHAQPPQRRSSRSARDAAQAAPEMDEHGPEHGHEDHRPRQTGPDPGPAPRARQRPQPLWTQHEQPAEAPAHEPEEYDEDYDDDGAVHDEDYDDEYEEDEVVVSAGGRTTRQLVSAGSYDDEEEDDEPAGRSSRSPRQSRTSRNTARMAVGLVLLVLVGLVTAGVIWLQGMFSDSDGEIVDGGPRLQIPVTGGGEGAQRGSRGPDRRDVDVDRFLENNRRSVEADALGQASTGGATATVDESLTGGTATAAVADDLDDVDVEAASLVAEAFLRANTAEERGRLIRNRETDLPLMMDFYQLHPGQLNLGGELGSAVIDQERRGYIGFRVLLSDGTERMIGLEKRTEGYRVDWPSFAIYHERAWRQFVDNRITNPTLVRVLAAPVDYYNFEFSDPDVFLCLRLENGRDRLGDEPLYGYIRRDHEHYEELARLIEISGGTDLPLVLRIKFPLLPSAPNQVEITELVSNGWMLRN